MAFGLPAGYRENAAITALDAGDDYWTPERIKASERYQWSVYRLALRLARERGARVVLDVGCGPATKLEALFGSFDVHGVDQAGAVELCRRLGRHGTFSAVDLSAPSDPAEVPVADVVICADVIEHLADPMPLLELTRSRCAATGVLVFSTPDRERLLGPDATAPSNPSHVREWTRAEFAALLREAGLTIVDHQTHLPFRLGLDKLTAAWLVDRARARRPLRSNQVVVCQPSSRA